MHVGRSGWAVDDECHEICLMGPNRQERVRRSSSWAKEEKIERMTTVRNSNREFVTPVH